MNRTFGFDPIAYRRLNLRWLLVVLVFSLALDAVIITVWSTTVATLANQYFVAIGMGFLCLLNQGLKAAAISRYAHSKKRLSKCYLQSDGNQIVHYHFIAGMPRWRQAVAAERIFLMADRNILNGRKRCIYET